MDELEKKGAFSSVSKNESDYSVLKEFKQWVNDSREKHVSAESEEVMKGLRRKVARRRWRGAIHAVRLAVRLAADSDISAKEQRAQNTAGKRKPTQGGLRGSLRNSFIDLGEAALSKAPQISKALSFISNQEKDKAAKGNIKDFINDAIEEPRFFIEGSLLSNLIESGIEVVYFGDRHPNDVVYCICCNRR